MSIRVLLCDDQALVRTGLRLILEAEGMDVVAEAANGREAIAAAQRLRPDVVLMDIRMPVLDGIEATRRLLDAPSGSKPVRVVMLSTFNADQEVLAALAAGASGYILKDAPSEELVRAIHAATDGHALLTPSVTKQVIGALPRRHRGPRSIQARRLRHLSERELDVLRLAARGHSNGQIALELALTEATVRTYISRMLPKLGVRDRVQAVVLAYDAGLVEPGDDGPLPDPAPARR